MYKILQQINKDYRDNPIDNWAKNLNMNFWKELIQLDINVRKTIQIISHLLNTHTHTHTHKSQKLHDVTSLQTHTPMAKT